jgi:hypothetical protein
MKGARQRAGRMLTGLALAYALGLGLSAVQLLPAMALSAQGQRSDIGFSLAPPEEYFGSMLRLIFPALGGFERIGPPPAWGPANFPGSLPLRRADTAGAGDHRSGDCTSSSGGILRHRRRSIVRTGSAHTAAPGLHRPDPAVPSVRGPHPLVHGVGLCDSDPGGNRGAAAVCACRRQRLGEHAFQGRLAHPPASRSPPDPHRWGVHRRVVAPSSGALHAAVAVWSLFHHDPHPATASARSSLAASG